jgi:hypothetical protein
VTASSGSPAPASSWPTLDYEAGRATLVTLHLWTQIVGKVRLALSPWVNHSWHVTLYPEPSGLTTGPIAHGDRVFDIRFDFRDHRLRIETADGAARRLALGPRSVASFHDELMSCLEELALPVTIHGRPNEIPDPVVPFAEDTGHATYEAEHAHAFWRALLQAHRVLTSFRAGFQGKASPVHFFWGSFDLAVTRFSGRRAPRHPGGVPNLPDRVTREAYSHEVSSAGFWPGNATVPYAAWYSYAYPTPPGFGAAPVEPAEAFWSAELGEFLLPYEAVRSAPSPDAVLERFLETTYRAAAELGGWDREALERERGAPTD